MKFFSSGWRTDMAWRLGLGLNPCSGNDFFVLWLDLPGISFYITINKSHRPEGERYREYVKTLGPLQ